MRKRVIHSLILGALAVMLASFLFLTPIYLYTFQTSAVNRVYSEIENNIEHIKPLAQMSQGFRTSKMMRMFDESMSQFAYFSKSRILFMDTGGNIIWANGIDNTEKVETYAYKALLAMSGKEKIKSQGLFDGLYNEKTITIGEYIKDDTGQKNLVVFCSSYAPDMSDQYKVVFWEVFLIELITLCFVAMFMFLFSKNITVPLKKINNTLKEFAKGNFDKRVKYNKDNELGELATNINQMADAVNSLEEMRHNFVSDISHELRTPMTSISGFLEGILDGTIPENEKDKYLSIALSESKRLSKLVNDLLNLSRIEDQVKKLNLEAFDLDELSKLVLIKFEDQITSKNINVEFELEGDEFIVIADRDKIIQVLTNLFHNAVKFTPYDGKISINLKKNNRKCFFSVSNTGYGIEPDKLNFIWERLYKGDVSRSTDKTGVGIGLYIVKKIIDAHDETITVSSKLNVDTTFTFTVALA